MKTKLTLSVILGLLAFSFILNNEKTADTNPVTAGSNTYKYTQPQYADISPVFLIGAMASGWDTDYHYHNALYLNMWHFYTSSERDATDNYRTKQGWDMNLIPGSSTDILDAPVNTSLVGGRINENISHSKRTLMDRPKFNMLCYGQRSDYQCEDRQKILESEDERIRDLSFYTFQSPVHSGEDVRDESIWGNGQYVRRCLLSADEAGIVVNRLRTNNEQVRTDVGNELTGDARYDWFIKPRIRIKPEDANANTRVCSLSVKRYDGQEILNVLINGDNFKDGQGNYNGDYIERFTDLATELIVSKLPYSTNNGNAFNPLDKDWPFSSRGDRATDGAGDNKMDIQVYWFGECDMWIDYIRVDNDIANDLLSEDPNNPLTPIYNNWITWETEYACNSQFQDNPLKFYIEEFEFNNIPCMQYVNNKIKSVAQTHGKNLSLMCDLNYPAYNAHLPYTDAAALDAGHVRRQLVERVGLSEIFGGPYPLVGSNTTPYLIRPEQTPYISYIPSTLPTTSGDLVFASTKPPLLYDEWLQNYLDKDYTK